MVFCVHKVQMYSKGQAVSSRRPPGRLHTALAHVPSPDSWDVFLVTVAGMKLLRASFCSPAPQFVHLGFAVIFFHFDCRGLSESLLLDFFVMSIVFSKASS